MTAICHREPIGVAISWRTSIKPHAGFARDARPLREFVPEIHSEALGRSARGLDSDLEEALAQSGIAERGVQRFVDFLHDGGRRLRGDPYAVPPVVLVTGQARFIN